MAMHHGELGTPTMAKANYSNQSYATSELLGGAFGAILSNAKRETKTQSALDQFMGLQAHCDAAPPMRAHQQKTQPQENVMPSRRIVQVYIADPSPDVPLEDAILYTGEQKMTDLTDQELFFEIDIRALLAAHNEKRAKIINKKVKDRTEYLEPAKVRDLKMVVVDVASF